MKKYFLISSFFLAVNAFGCQDCIEKIQDRIDYVSNQLMHLEPVETQDFLRFQFFYGELQAYYDCLQILEKSNHSF